MKKTEYVLGTGIDELERLAIQHRIWADATVMSWKRAGISPGCTVLDLGSGPGHATFDLAQLVTHHGKIIAFDESESFMSFVKAEADRRNLSQIETQIGDVHNLTASFPEPIFDYIYCRWVLCWLKHPEKAIQGMMKVLKPGGKVIIHDYFNWKTMTIAPRSKYLDMVIDKTIETFNERGGDIDVAARLPSLLKESGFSLQHFDTHQRVAQGGGKDSTIYWPITWWKTFAPKLVDSKKLSATDCEKALQDLDTLAVDETKFYVCPTVYEFIAQK
jgi:ubiquinone/menaquinone biosynthesis C-methylase UbiE